MISNCVKEYRKKNNYSQEYLASLLSVSRQTVISIEKGKFYPSLELSFKLARLFEVSIEDLFKYEEE
ncbi:helix-turn-helix transcriptional regulator [Salinicoccus carnicancri]|uniref:helix-turn-helix transcriptional regulator n=1 Tax=Salinicoccus carnicancri TaxID=558170 RepID=UPI00036DE9AC|nr:helix-turn-helix transcriptional regulator [Salinicoccus carnicancri]